MPGLRVSHSWAWPAGILLLSYLLPQDGARSWAVKWALLAAALAAAAMWATGRAVRRGFPQDSAERGIRTRGIPAIAWAVPVAWLGMATVWGLDPGRNLEQALVVGWAAIIIATGSFRPIPSAFIAPLLAVAGLDLLVGSWQFGRGIARPYGIFVNANHHAALMSVAYAIIAAQAVRRSFPGSLVRHLAALLFLGAAALSGTRSIFLAAPAALLAAYLAGPKRVNRRSLLLACLLAAGVLANPAGPARRVIDEARGNDPFSLKRIDIWTAAGKMVRDRPLLGTGLGGFPEAFPAVRPPDLAKYHAEYAHSELIGLAAEAGLAGTGLAIWLGVCLFRIILRRRPLDTGEAGAFSCIAALSVFCLFGFPLHVPVLAIACAGAIWVLLPAPEPGMGKLRPHRFAALAGMAGLGLPAVWIILSGMSELNYIRGAELAREGDAVGARQSLMRAAGINPFHAGAALGLAELERDANSARELFRKVRTLRPAWVPPLAGLFRGAFFAGNLSGAEELHVDARRLDPHGLETRLMDAKLSAMRGDVREAETALNRLRDAWPGNLDVMLARAEIAAVTGDRRRAREIAGRVLSLYPGNMAATEILRGIE